MKVSGAMAMADDIEAFGITEFGGKVGGGMASRVAAIDFDRLKVDSDYRDLTMRLRTAELFFARKTNDARREKEAVDDLAAIGGAVR